MEYTHLLFYFANVIIHAGVYTFLIIYPFKSKLRYNIKNTISIILLWVLITAVSDILFFEITALLPNLRIPMMFVWILISALFMLILIKSSPSQLVFVLFALFGFQNNIIYFSRLLYSLEPLPTILSWFPELNYLIYTVIILIVAFPFMGYLFCNLFKKVVDTKIDFLQWQYLVILPFIYSVYCHISKFGGIHLSQPQASDFTMLLILNIFAYLSYFTALTMLLKSYEIHTANEHMAIMTKQLEMQKNQYKKLTNNIEKTSRLRHDWRHHLLLIKNYAENKDLEGLEHYLINYVKDYIPQEESPICENHSVDIIIQHYIGIAKSSDSNIDTSDISVNIPSKIGISDYDLCIVFGNLIENAVESCLKQTTGKKFIKIKAIPVGEQLALMVQNSYDGKIIVDKDNFPSTKHDGYGIGLSSVRSITEKYNGSFDVNYKNNIFKVTVLLSA